MTTRRDALRLAAWAVALAVLVIYAFGVQGELLLAAFRSDTWLGAWVTYRIDGAFWRDFFFPGAALAYIVLDMRARLKRQA